MATLNQSDQQVWKKVLAAKNQTMTQAQIQQSLPGMAHRELTTSITALMDLQLLKVETSKDGPTMYRGVKPKDAKKSKASLTAEQNMVLSLVKGAHNRGISQKALRGQIGAETIPTTLLRKTLDSLEKNDFIKSFRSIHQPTIALYISPNLKPAEDLSGGVWYDGQKEYDADFVNGITTFLYEKVKAATFPANDLRNPAHVKLVSKAIYPIARTKKLPTPYTLLQALKKSNLTQVKMKIPNIMECMRALELDGLVEAIKPVGGVEVPDIMGESDDEGPSKTKANESETDEDERERQKEKAKEIAKDKKKREKVKERRKLKAERAEEKAKEKEKRAKKRAKEKEKDRERRRKDKRKKHKSVASSTECSSDGDDSDVLVAIGEEPKRKKNSKRRRVQSDEESEDDRRGRRSSKKHKGEKQKSDTDPESESEDERHRKQKSKKRRRSKSTESESSEVESEVESDSDISVSSVDSDELDMHDVALKPKSTAAAVDTSDLQTVVFARTDLGELTDYHVAYRATNLVNLPLGQTQISCGKCPQFNFCQEGGPVDPDSCAYIDDWLADVVGGWDAEARKRYQDEAAAAAQDGRGQEMNGEVEDEDQVMSDGDD